MFEMGSYDPFGFLKHELWPKEGPWVKLAVWLPTTKSRESPWFPCMQVACHMPLKSSRWGLQLALNLTSIRGFHTKLWASKVVGVPILGISGLPLGSPGTKWHLGAGPVARHREYYEGEGGGFPQVWAMMSLVRPCLPMARSCTKSVPIMYYQLVVWFV
jgi:hypothetical protein